MTEKDPMKNISKVYAFILSSVVVAFFFTLPVWPYSQNWGVYPAIAIGFALLLVLFLKLGGREKHG